MFLNSLNRKFDIFIFRETWFRSANDSLGFTGCKGEGVYRKGGGLYFHNNLYYEVLF